MKYLVALILPTLLAACGGSNSSNNASSANSPQAERLIKYVNNLALSNPGWDNNNVTKDEFYTKLCTQFSKHMLDSNLLKNAFFALENLEESDNKHYLATFKAYDVKGLSMPGNNHDSTEIHFSLISIVSDSMAKTIKNGELYYLESFAKDPKDSSFTPDIITSPIDENNGTHTISSCWLGTYKVTVQKIKNINDN